MKKPWLRCIAIAVFAAGPLVAASPAAFADSGSGPSSAVTTSVLHPTPDTISIVYRASLLHSGTSYGEVDLWYNSANEEVEGTITLDSGVAPGWVAEVCLQTSSDAPGVYETCTPIYSGTTDSTGWYADASITTRAYGVDDIPSGGGTYFQAIGTTSYY